MPGGLALHKLWMTLPKLPVRQTAVQVYRDETKAHKLCSYPKNSEVNVSIMGLHRDVPSLPSKLEHLHLPLTKPVPQKGSSIDSG